MITTRVVLIQNSVLLPILVKQVTVTTATLLRNRKKKEKETQFIMITVFPIRFARMASVSFTSLLPVSEVFGNLLRVSIVFVYLSLQDQIVDMRTGPKPIGRLLMPKILQVLGECGCDLRTWTVAVRIRTILDRPHLRWETVHKYLEQMVQEQMIFRYEDPTGIVTYSKNPIVREKVLF